MDNETIRKFKAVLEAEQPFFIKDALDISRDLDKYGFERNLTHACDYARMQMCEKFGLDDDDSIFEFVNNTLFGTELMRRNGMTATQYGAVTVPPEIEKTQTADEQPNDTHGEEQNEGMQML